jgi:DNA gyrase/topoisomerase IV subunit A
LSGHLTPDRFLALHSLYASGCNGIATGWSTSVPNFNPLDVVNNLRRRLSGLPFESMSPWYSGFEGVIEEVRWRRRRRRRQQRRQ